MATMTLSEKVIRAAHGLSVTVVNPKAFISDVYAALVAQGDVASDELDNFKGWLVSMHRRGILSLSRCDLAEAFSGSKLRESETRYLGVEFHFIRG